MGDGDWKNPIPFAISHLPFPIRPSYLSRPARIRQHRRKDTPPVPLNITKGSALEIPQKQSEAWNSAAEDFKGRALGYETGGAPHSPVCVDRRRWSPPVVSRMIVLLRHASTETTDGNLSQAVWQLARVCIPLFRSHRHSGLPPAVDP